VSRHRLYVCCALIVWLISGCSLWGALSPKSLALKGLVVQVMPGANDDSPIALDFVVVRDPELIKPINELTAAAWFAGVDQWRIDHEQQASITRYELVPGQTLPINQAPFLGARGVALFVFASYQAPGTHRLRLEHLHQATLHLEAKKIRVVARTQ
jgi:type VI secretion system protein